ncbi:MAG: class I SAM-dependent methyltransferase [Solirubrobacterales bacterium]
MTRGRVLHREGQTVDSPAKAEKDYHQPGVLRVLQTREETRAFYDKIAKVYDLLAERSEEPVRRAGLQMLGARPGEKILEIGSGTGRSLVDLAKAIAPSGRVFGVDLSEKMLQLAQDRARREGVDDLIEITRGDALHLSCPERTLDGVFMSFTLELFDTPEIPQVLAECRRVLKDEGRLVVVGMSRVQPNGLMTTILEWAHRHLSNYLDCRPILVRRAIEDAGFEIADYAITRMWGNVEIVCGAKGKRRDNEGGLLIR